MKMKIIYQTLSLLFFLALSNSVISQQTGNADNSFVPATAAPAIIPLEIETTEVANNKPMPVAIELILDLSGSMKGKIAGKSKIRIAREALKDTLKTLNDPVFLVGLRAYGFDSSVEKTKAASCPNTKLLTKITGNNLREIAAIAYKLKPYGYTPIAQSLLLAGKDLKDIDAESRMIILITDGKETCDGDPIATAKKLCEMGINQETHIVGFDLEVKTADDMRKVAKAGCGTYVDAKNSKELTNALNSIVAKAKDKIDPTWLRTIHPIEGGKTPETAVEISPGTYTLTRTLEKGEAMYFRVPTKLAQHGLIRGLLQSKRLIRKGAELIESEYGMAQFSITVYPPDDKKKRGRAVRLAGEPGTYKSIGYSDTYGEGFIFSISSNYDRVHPDSLFNVEIREAGDINEAYEAAAIQNDKTLTLPLDQTIVGHLGEGDFIDVMQIPTQAIKGEITLSNPELAFRVTVSNEKGKRLFRSRAQKGSLDFEIPKHTGIVLLTIEDKTPKLKQVFTSYELSISSK